MGFRFLHTNLNVLNLEKSLDFYHKALGLSEVRRKQSEDGSFTLVFLTDEEGRYQLELTWLTERTEPYDLSNNEIHVAFETDDGKAAHRLHSELGCVCLENKTLGVYFIEDPDGYWTEIIPVDRCW